MQRILFVLLLSLGMWVGICPPASARVTGPSTVPHSAQVRDIAQIRASKVLRVLVNQSRNSSGQVKGEAIGVEARRLEAFETFLNQGVAPGKRVRIKLVPKAKEQLLAALQRGEGDLVAPGELIQLPADARQWRASRAVGAPLHWVLVGSRGQKRYSRVEQLAGKTIMLPAASAAAALITELNHKLAARHLRPVQVEWADPSLAVEDVLEMVAAGIFPLTVVEQPIAERWATVLPRLSLEHRLALGSSASLTWFVRQQAPGLLAQVDAFIEGWKPPKGQDAAFAKVYKNAYTVHYPLARDDRQRLEKLRPVLQRHAREQRMDWLNLAALAFKESDLNPSAKGASGATGLLQITPSAARRVGVGQVHDLDSNVQAASRYLAMIRSKFFASNRINERERMAFTLAAYNMGPERVQAMRAEARRRGLNPNQWFFQTERIAMEQIGMTAVGYVNSVNKYFLAFDRERESLEPRAGRRVASLP